LVSIEILRPAQQAPSAQMQILAPWHGEEQHPQAGQAQELALDFSSKRHIISFVRRVDVTIHKSKRKRMIGRYENNK
jgi:hypothetical protein